MQRIFPNGASYPSWKCLTCGKEILDDTLRSCFCDAFNSIVNNKESYIKIWDDHQKNGTPLERLRARQMMEITAEGTIPFEVPELTQAVLQEAWIEEDNRIVFVFLTGDRLTIKN